MLVISKLKSTNSTQDMPRYIIEAWKSPKSTFKLLLKSHTFRPVSPWKKTNDKDKP